MHHSSNRKQTQGQKTECSDFFVLLYDSSAAEFSRKRTTWELSAPVALVTHLKAMSPVGLKVRCNTLRLSPTELSGLWRVYESRMSVLASYLKIYRLLRNLWRRYILCKFKTCHTNKLVPICSLLFLGEWNLPKKNNY